MMSVSSCEPIGTNLWSRSLGRAAWLGACLAMATVDAGRAAQFELASIPSGETTVSQHSAISADGRFAAFLSDGQAFLYDRETATKALVSRSAASATTPGNGVCGYPALSADGRYAAVACSSTDLVAGQSEGNGGTDVFLYDRVTGTTTLVSHASGVATLTGNGESDFPNISADGRYVVFHSYASDLVAGVSDPLAGSHDVFLYDRIAGTTTLVSRSAASSATTANHHSEFPVLNADGRFIVFLSYATNLVAGQSDSNANYDLFLFDRVAGTMTLVTKAHGFLSKTANDRSTMPAITPDGSYIAFWSLATNLVADQDGSGSDIFLYERASGTMRLVSGRGGSPTEAAGGYGPASLSADGRFVVFESSASDLVSGQVDPNEGILTSSDVFLFDRIKGTTTLVSHAFGSATTTGSLDSKEAAVSANGRYVAFNSYAKDLVPGLSPQPNGPSTYHFDRLAGAIRLLTRSADDGSDIFNSFGRPAISEAGNALALTTRGRLAPEDLDWNEDVYLWTDFSTGRSLFTVPPCRLFDSRTPANAPALSSGSPRILNVRDLCGIPETAAAIAANVTVTQSTGAGYLVLHAGDMSAPQTSTINFSGGQTRSNNAVLALAPGGALAIAPQVVGNGSVHVIVDVAGYFE
jgi:Tol biopolymer transport system component